MSHAGSSCKCVIWPHSEPSLKHRNLQWASQWCEASSHWLFLDWEVVRRRTKARTPKNPLRGLCQPNWELSRHKKNSTAPYCPDCDTDLSQVAEIVWIPHRHMKKPWKNRNKMMYAGPNKLRLPPPKLSGCQHRPWGEPQNCPDCATYMSGFLTLKLSESAWTSAPKVKILSRPWHRPYSGFSGVLQSLLVA